MRTTWFNGLRHTLRLAYLPEPSISSNCVWKAAPSDWLKRRIHSALGECSDRDFAPHTKGSQPVAREPPIFPGPATQAGKSSGISTYEHLRY
jgi:hypothetical protein